jgi:hypothetical protein
MKKLILITMLFVATFSNAQSEESISKTREAISKIQIKSKVALSYSPRLLEKDTVYITIDKWNYEPIKGVYKASIIDYVKNDKGGYEVINKKNKFFVKAQIDQVFKALNNPILTTESYSKEIDILLSKALLMETQMDLSEDGKTIYGGLPAIWTIPMQ